MHALRLRDDWLAPASSLDFLLSKMPDAHRTVATLGSDDLGGAPADHFSWMKAPDAVASRIAEGLPPR